MSFSPQWEKLMNSSNCPSQTNKTHNNRLPFFFYLFFFFSFLSVCFCISEPVSLSVCLGDCSVPWPHFAFRPSVCLCALPVRELEIEPCNKRCSLFQIGYLELILFKRKKKKLSTAALPKNEAPRPVSLFLSLFFFLSLSHGKPCTWSVALIIVIAMTKTLPFFFFFFFWHFYSWVTAPLLGPLDSACIILGGFRANPPS